MPSVSFYMSNEILEAVRERSKSQNISVSQIIQKAIEQHLSIDEKSESKSRVLNFFLNNKIQDQLGSWDDSHEERSNADAGRR